MRPIISSAAEVALINLLTVMTMNEGMASTFVPCACKADPPGR